MNIRLLAQNLIVPGDKGNVTLKGPVSIGSNHIGDVVNKVIPYFFVFAGIGLLFMLIMGGFTLLTGASDPKQIESGKKKITNALIGFFIVFLAYWIVQLVGLIFGLTEFKTIFGP